MAAFVAFSATGTLTIQEGTDLLVVVVTRNDAVGAEQTATWDPVVGDTLNLSVAHNSNDWTQVYYLVDPPAGDGQVFATGTHVEHIYVGQYSGDLSFDSAQAGDDNESFQFSPSGAAVMVYGMIAFSTSHTPVAGCTERADEDGSYYCDRIESSGGTYTVGITSGDEPAGVGVLFVEAATGVEVSSGTLTLPALELSGSATVAVGVSSGTLTLPSLELSGSATVAVGVSAGTLTLPSLELSGTATVGVSVSNATLTLPSLELSGTVTTEALLALPGTPVARATIRAGQASVAAGGGVSSHGTQTGVVASADNPTVARTSVRRGVSSVVS